MPRRRSTADARVVMLNTSWKNEDSCPLLITCYLVRPVPTDVEMAKVCVIPGGKSVLAQDTHCKAGLLVLVHSGFLIRAVLNSRLNCSSRSNVTASVTNRCTLGKALCKMLQPKSQRHFNALLAKARAACRSLQLKSLSGLRHDYETV